MLRRTTVQGGRSAELVKLTPRERSLLRLYCSGRTSKEIASELTLTSGTVDQGLKLLALALRLQGRRQLTKWAFQNPGAFVAETWVEPGLHPEGCGCASIYCTAMRVASAADPAGRALEEYRKGRDRLREAESAQVKRP